MPITLNSITKPAAETVVLPAVPKDLRLKRDKAIAAFVIKKGMAIAEAAAIVDGLMQTVDLAVADAAAKRAQRA